MKALLSIFLLSIFFLFQYGRMIDYMECRITAAVQSSSGCDCESKLLPLSGDQEPAVPFHQHHLKNYTEEFFDHQSLPLQANISKDLPAYNCIVAPQQLSGYLQERLQPPRC